MTARFFVFAGIYLLSMTTRVTSNWCLQVFVWWVFLALIHSVLVFVLPYLSMTQDVAWGHGRVGDYLVVGNMIYTYVVVTVCLKAGQPQLHLSSLQTVWSGNVCVEQETD